MLGEPWKRVITLALALRLATTRLLFLELTSPAQVSAAIEDDNTYVPKLPDSQTPRLQAPIFKSATIAQIILLPSDSFVAWNIPYMYVHVSTRVPYFRYLSSYRASGLCVYQYMPAPQWHGTRSAKANMESVLNLTLAPPGMERLARHVLVCG